MIDSEEVRHIARLARIDLTEDEKKKFREELSAILAFVEKLNEADAGNVKPLTGGAELLNSMREDKQIDKNLEGKQTAILEQVPERKDAWVKVKAVFGDESR